MELETLEKMRCHRIKYNGIQEIGAALAAWDDDNIDMGLYGIVAICLDVMDHLTIYTKDTPELWADILKVVAEQRDSLGQLREGVTFEDWELVLDDLFTDVCAARSNEITVGTEVYDEDDPKMYEEVVSLAAAAVNCHKNLC